MAIDNFDTDGVTLGANWATQTSHDTLQVVAAIARVINTSTASGNYRTAESYGAAHSSLAVIQNVSAVFREASVRVRCQAGANTFYAGGVENFILGSQAYRIWKCVAGTLTSLVLHGSLTASASDIVKLSVDSGYILTLNVNGTNILTFDDTVGASVTGGTPGMGSFASSAANAWDSWVSTGDAAGAAPGPLLFRRSQHFVNDVVYQG